MTCPVVGLADDCVLATFISSLQRLKVDLLVAQRIADANAQMKQQMLHLVASEVEEQYSAEQQLTGTAEENELAGLFAQTETIQSRLKDVKTQCFEFTNVGQTEMDQMYVVGAPCRTVALSGAH